MISPDDLRKQAEDIDRERDIAPPRSGTRYFYIILAIILISLMVLMVIPRYAVRLDPRPVDIPLPSEVIPELSLPNINTTGRDRAEHFTSRIVPVRSEIKLTADRIVSASCRNTAGDGRVCHAKALHLFVRDNMIYIGDPPDEYLKTPEESLLTLGGDCDDHAILLSSLLSAVGIRTRLAFIPRHVYVEAYIPGALEKYKTDDGWVAMDPTCDSCGFGEIPWQNQKFTPTRIYI